MSHDAYVEYSTESVRCRGTETYSYGMARHGTRIVAAYICALESNSPTEDSEDRAYIEKPRAGRHIWIYSSYVYLVRT